MADLGKAWAIVRGRLSGNKEKAQADLNSMHPLKRTMVQRAQAQSRTRRRKRAYKLGERIRK